MSSNKRIQIPNVTVDDPNLQQFIDAVVHNNRFDSGELGINEKRPTVQDLIDAAVTNAENIT